MLDSSNSTSSKRQESSSHSRQTSSSSSVYPLHPIGTEVLLRISGNDFTLYDHVLVIASSLFVVGGFIWVPITFYKLVIQKYYSIPKSQTKKRRLYLSIIVTLSILYLFGPHRNHKFGKWIQVRKWSLWKAWLRYIAMEVVRDTTTGTTRTSTNTATTDVVNSNPSMMAFINQQSILAFVPHGIFPFAFAFGILPDIVQRQIFGTFRPIVATATNYFPIVNDFLLWLHKVDASRSAVNTALANGDRIGIVPGGIAEIFEGYPKPGTTPNEEYTIVRKGFIQLAYQYNIPVVPIYCFGATKMFRRWDIPLLQYVSKLVRMSIVIFYGSILGLPIPYRQKLLYVIGNPIYPPPPPSTLSSSSTTRTIGTPERADDIVDRMHQQFCDELYRIFDRHKEAYGWGHKSLNILSR